MPHIPTEIPETEPGEPITLFPEEKEPQQPSTAGAGNILGDGPGIDIQDFMLVMMITKLSKTKEGLKTLQVLGKAMIDGTFKTLGYLAQASAANRIAAWVNPILISYVLERWRFIRPGILGNLHLGATIIAGATVAPELISAIAGFIPFTKPADANFPDQITFAAESMK